MLRSSSVSRFLLLAGATALTVLPACSDTGTPVNGGGGGGDLTCSIPDDKIVDGGVGRGGIPAISNPPVVSVGDPGASYLRPDDRVIEVRVDGQAFAIPHNVLWWHEIVNLDFGDTKLAVTYCPLTGSSLAFDRSGIDGSKLGVSGLLFQNNLMMFDEDTESLWPQMSRGARCGPAGGTTLTMHPAREVRWSRWQELHPDGQVLSNQTGFQSTRDYQQYPYGDYEQLNNSRLLFPESQEGLDGRRPPKERVLGIPTGPATGVAVPFRALDQLGSSAAAEMEVAGDRTVVFWDREAWSAAAYQPEVDGQELTFEADGGTVRDTETGSVWRIDGLATSGALEGTRLEPVTDAYVAFWFAWAAFHPATNLWSPPA